MTLTYTRVEDMVQLVNELRKSFSQNLTRPLTYRKQQLQQLYLMIDDNENELLEALYQDLHKPRDEAWLSEMAFAKQEIIDAINQLDKWAAPEKVQVGMAHYLNNCHIRKEPIGTALIIGSWNYPINLIVMPLVGAIAAGCTCICKPSEVATHTAAVITKLFQKYLDHNAYRIVNGGPKETIALLQCKFDHVFYTGNGTVGRLVMAEAAKNLTRVTLELGGKSPCIIAKDANLAISAKRIIWAKAYNCGQTCIAPDYILCERSIQDELLDHMGKALKELHGIDVQKSSSYARVINQKHFDRLISLLNETKGRVIIDGKPDRDDLYIAPTVVTDVPKDDKLMEDEIFGPILPIVAVENIDEAISFVNSRDQPLCLYPFSNNQKTIRHILDNTRSGGSVINDCMLHVGVPNLPFGGTGPSGIGNYHGKRSFDTFSYERAIMISPFYAEKLLDSRYPPYTESKMKFLKWLFFTQPNFKRRNNYFLRRSGKIFTAIIVLAIAYSMRDSSIVKNFLK